MQYEVKTISVFERQFKKLAKKYPSLKTDLKSLVSDLEKEPSIGTPLGNLPSNAKVGMYIIKVSHSNETKMLRTTVM